MTIQKIYATYTPGSTGFATAVTTHLDGLGISREEATRLGEACGTPEQFMAQWENEDWWTDDRAYHA